IRAKRKIVQGPSQRRSPRRAPIQPRKSPDGAADPSLRFRPKNARNPVPLPKRFSHVDKNNAFRLKSSCRPRQAHLLDSQFLRLFWGEQPPFASFRTWGAVLPSDDGTAILFPTFQLEAGVYHYWAEHDRRGSFCL